MEPEMGYRIPRRPERKTLDDCFDLSHWGYVGARWLAPASAHCISRAKTGAHRPATTFSRAIAQRVAVCVWSVCARWARGVAIIGGSVIA